MYPVTVGGSAKQGCHNLYGEAPMTLGEDRLSRQETGQEAQRGVDTKVTQLINSVFRIPTQSWLRLSPSLKETSLRYPKGRGSGTQKSLRNRNRSSPQRLYQEEGALLLRCLFLPGKQWQGVVVGRKTGLNGVTVITAGCRDKEGLDLRKEGLTHVSSGASVRLLQSPPRSHGSLPLLQCALLWRNTRDPRQIPEPPVGSLQ